MPRVKRSVATRARKKKVIKAAKGAYGLRKNVYRRAKETTLRAAAFATKHRRFKKRAFRTLWTMRLNSALRENGTTYSRFIGAMKKANITLNRKVLAELAVNDKPAFSALVEKVKTAA